MSETESDVLFDYKWSKPPCLIDAGTMLARASDEQSFLFANAIPTKSITMIIGEPGASKSWLAYALADAVLHHTPWMGIPNVVGRPGKVLVLNYDSPDPDCGRRFKRLGIVPDDPIWFHSAMGLDDDQTMRLPEHARNLRRLTLPQYTDADLVIIDSLRQCHPLNENASEDMQKVMASIRALTSHGATVVVIHHSNKNTDVGGMLSARGSSAIVADADAVVLCSGEVATWAKTRGWKMPEGSLHWPFEVVDLEGGRTVVRHNPKAPDAKRKAAKK